MNTDRKVILQEFVTVDGYAADEEGKLDFIVKLTDEINKDQFKFIDTIDTILLGTNTYRMFVEFWPTATTDKDILADKLNSTPKVVFSKTLEKAPWGKWEDAKIVQDDAASTISKMKQETGKDMVIWGSISLAQSLMKKGIVDEYQLFICPVVLGKGKPLFSKGITIPDMQLLGTKTYDDGSVFLKYKVNERKVQS
ncbi:MAG: dihydrofolate reductase family protein [Pricia sp.]